MSHAIILFITVAISSILDGVASCEFPEVITRSNGEKGLKIDCSGSDIFSFAGLGDWGEDEVTKPISTIVKSVQGNKNIIDFILALGDNFYNCGVESVHDSQWNSTWFNRFDVDYIGAPWIGILGNHDVSHCSSSNGQAQVDFHDAGKPGSPYWFMPDYYYTVDIVNSDLGTTLEMIVLETDSIGKTQVSWFENKLEASRNPKIILGHHQLFSLGGRGDTGDKYRKQMINLMKDYNSEVIAYLGGHEHNMQYLRSSGVDYMVLGGSGRDSLGRFDEGSDADTVYAAESWGYAMSTYNFKSNSLSTKFHLVDRNGNEKVVQI